MPDINPLQLFDPSVTSNNPLQQGAPSLGQAVNTAIVDPIQQWVAAERARSIQMGLMDPKTGLPTTAGLVDAAKKYASGVMMGTAAPGEAVPAFQHMLDQIKSDPEAHWGVRVTEDPLTPGQRLNRSRVWNEGEPTTRFVPGTSSVGVWQPDEQGLQLALKQAGVAPYGVPWNYYVGRHVSLLRGSDSVVGTDVGERLLKNAKVAATYMKQDDGPSELLPVRPSAAAAGKQDKPDQGAPNASQ